MAEESIETRQRMEGIITALRTFIAVEAAPETRDNAQRLIRRLAASAAPVRWVEPENLHFTLKFLGDVDPRKTPGICNAVAEAAAEQRPFPLKLVGAGAFPGAHRPRIVWIGVRQGEDELRALHEAIDERLVGQGFSPEGRRYRGHLTIGRVKGRPRDSRGLARLLEENRDYEVGTMSVEKVVVFSSELTSEGPVYTPLGTAELG